MALLLYAVSVALRLAAPQRRQAARLAWTLGCLIFLVHVAFAFHVFHAWSHDDAYARTARQTQELIGPHWGGGLFFNYLFTIAWVLDAAYWWAAGVQRYEGRPRWVDGALHGFMAFMAINGAIVFAAGPTRWVALAVGIALGLLAVFRFRGVRLGRLGAPG